MVYGLVKADIPQGHRSSGRYTVGLAYLPIPMGKMTAKQASKITTAEVIAAARQDGFRNPQVLAIAALKAKAARRSTMLEFPNIRKGVFARRKDKAKRRKSKGRRSGR
jgi:hypothetical protein